MTVPVEALYRQLFDNLFHCSPPSALRFYYVIYLSIIKIVKYPPQCQAKPTLKSIDNLPAEQPKISQF